jgi:hypothetical protein
LLVTKFTSVWTCAVRWLALLSRTAIADPLRLSVTVGITVIPRLRNASMTVWSPAPGWPVMVVAPVAWYQNGEALLQRSAFCVTEFSDCDIVQYGSQPLTIRRGGVSADADRMTMRPVTSRTIARAAPTRARIRTRGMPWKRARGMAQPYGPPHRVGISQTGDQCGASVVTIERRGHL